MKRFAIVSYNMYCNFTNYGSALQTYALHKAINQIAPTEIESIVLDYCPDILSDKDILNPMKHMWDTDPIARELCRLTLPAIKINNDKFNSFYKKNYALSSQKYTASNFDESFEKENLSGYVCGSDTIFCIDEFGFDDGYYANFAVMREHSVAYAASFGDSHFTKDTYQILKARLQNFKALAIRERQMISLVEEYTNVPVKQVLDPTLLLKLDDYRAITGGCQCKEPYILLYARRYNKHMEDYAQRIAKERGLKIVEISLRATNKNLGHEMRYDAGVEEFLSLINNAELVITNSFHGMIFAVQFCKSFIIFSREQCNTKIQELLELFGIRDRLFVTGSEPEPQVIDYDAVHHRIDIARIASISFLTKELTEYLQ